MVGYSLPPTKAGQKPDLRPRRVRVRALRPGLTVRARQLSAAGPPPQERAITTATLVASPLPGGRIPLALHAASFAAPGGKARALVTLEVGGDAILFSERAGKMAASLQYRIVATDVTGKVAAGESKMLEFHVSAARRDQLRDSRTRLVASLDLPPGSYRIRAAVLDAGKGEHGVVAGDLDVGRYDKGVTLSTVEIASTVEAHTPTMRANLSLFENRLSGPPTTQRTFDRADTLDAFAEAYAAKATADQVHVRATLLREDGGQITEPKVTVTREKGIGGVLCSAIRTRVPLRDLEPGNYRLKIDVQAAGTSVERSISFIVR